MSGVVLLELLSESGENCVYFKEDGGRFTQTQTLKLAVNTAYLIRVSCKEKLKCEEVIVNGESTLFQQKPDSSENKIYEGLFKTEGIMPTKSDARDVICLQIPLEHLLLVVVQCKFYKESKKGISWGTSLKNIVVNYNIEEGEEGVNAVLKSVKCRKLPVK